MGLPQLAVSEKASLNPMGEPRSPTRWPHALGSAALVAGTGVTLAVLLLEGAWSSSTLVVAALGGMGLLLLLARLGSVHRLLVLLLFLSASLDISKAIVPPLDRFYAPGLYITLAQAVLILWTVLWMGKRLVIERSALPFTRLDGWALAFLALNWWGALRSPAGGLAIASAVAYSLCVLAFYMVSHALRSMDDVRLALRGLLVTFVAQAVFTAAQMIKRAPIPVPGLKVSDLSAMTVSLGESGAFRPFGLFDHPNTLADYVIWLLLPALALVLLGRQRIAARVWWIALLTALASTGMLLATLSRGGWAATLLGAAVIAVIYTRRGLLGRRHAALAAAGAVTALLTVAAVYPQVFLRLTEPDGRSTESRLLLNDQAFKIIGKHPLLGVGLGGYNESAFNNIPSSWADVSIEYHEALLHLVVHNSYLLTAAELGIPGAIAWALLLMAMARQGWPVAQWRQPATFALGVGLAGAVIAHMLYLASDNYYIDIRIFILWLAAGLLQALTLLEKRPTPGTTEAAWR